MINQILKLINDKKEYGSFNGTFQIQKEFTKSDRCVGIVDSQKRNLDEVENILIIKNLNEDISEILAGKLGKTEVNLT